MNISVGDKAIFHTSNRVRTFPINLDVRKYEGYICTLVYQYFVSPSSPIRYKVTFADNISISAFLDELTLITEGGNNMDNFGQISNHLDDDSALISSKMDDLERLRDKLQGEVEDVEEVISTLERLQESIDSSSRELQEVDDDIMRLLNE